MVTQVQRKDAPEHVDSVAFETLGQSKPRHGTCVHRFKFGTMYCLRAVHDKSDMRYLLRTGSDRRRGGFEGRLVNRGHHLMDYCEWEKCVLHTQLRCDPELMRP